MGNPIQKIERSQSTCPASLLKDEISTDFPKFWAIGNLDILIQIYWVFLFNPMSRQRYSEHIRLYAPTA
jgi:hypothetical protein